MRQTPSRRAPIERQSNDKWRITQTIVQWLAEIGMERYAPLFEAQRIELDVIADLSDADLKEIGIAALGDRKRILSVIAQGKQETPRAPSRQRRPACPRQRKSPNGGS